MPDTTYSPTRSVHSAPRRPRRQNSGDARQAKSCSTDLLRLLDTLAQQQGRADQAIQTVAEITSANSTNCTYFLDLADALLQRGKPAKAIEHYLRAIQIEPSRAEAYVRLGRLWRRQGAARRAEDCFRQAIEMQPDDTEARSQLAETLLASGDMDGAIEQLREALRIDPGHGESHLRLGQLLHRQQRFDEAVACYDAGLCLRPRDSQARLIRALIALRQEDWNVGWREFECRRRAQPDTLVGPSSCPRWTGDNASDKTILIHSEGKLADDVMFASCLPDLIAQAKTCVVHCDRRLVPLFARSFRRAVVLPAPADEGGSLGPGDEGKPPSGTKPDAQIRMGSLPRYLRPTTASFPATPGYLIAKPSLRKSWRRRLASIGSKPKVGLCWRPLGTPRLGANSPKGLDVWAPLLEREDAHFVNLLGARGEREAAQRENRHGPTLHSLDGVRPWDDIEGYAALLVELDLVITVANSAAHLAGALGANVWTVLSACPSWRWGLRGQTSLWYPNMRLFRQESDGDWPQVIRALAEATNA